MKQKIITAMTASKLNEKISHHIEDGWKPIGSHTVINMIAQNKYSGSQHIMTIFDNEYAQSMIKES